MTISFVFPTSFPRSWGRASRRPLGSWEAVGSQPLPPLAPGPPQPARGPSASSAPLLERPPRPFCARYASPTRPSFACGPGVAATDTRDYVRYGVGMSYIKLLMLASGMQPELYND